MKALSECFLYTFVDTGYLHGCDLERVTVELCEGGSDLVQLRAKDRSPDDILRLAEQILPITDGAGVGLVINDHLSVAVAKGAPACHLGQEDFFDAGYSHRSQIFPANRKMLLGLSTHSPAQAKRAVAAGADYIAIGPVFPTPTKPSAPAVTLEFVHWAAANISIPWFAIGGINFENLDQVIAAGARRICVVSAILGAPDLALACQQFKNRLASAEP